MNTLILFLTVPSLLYKSLLLKKAYIFEMRPLVFKANANLNLLGFFWLYLSGDAHASRPLHKMDGVFFFFRFVGQLLEHPVWRHLPLPAH